MNYWLVDLSNFFLVNYRLVVLMDNVLVLFMNFLLMVFMNYVLMVFVYYFSVMFLNNRLSHMCLNFCRKNILVYDSRGRMSLKYCFFLMTNHLRCLLKSSLNNGFI